MKLKDFQSYISANVYSLCGYLSFVFWLAACFYGVPKALEVDKINGTEPLAYGYYMMFLIGIFTVNCVLLLILLSLIAIEFFVRRKCPDLSAPNLAFLKDKTYAVALWSGFVLSLTPLVLACFMVVQAFLFETHWQKVIMPNLKSMLSCFWV